MKRPDFTPEQVDWICWTIGEWYLVWKDKMTEGGVTHNLGFAKEKLKEFLFPLQGEILYRPHRGSFDESMKEVFEIESIEDIKKKHPEIDPENTAVVWYGFDSRNMWNTFLVIHAGAPIGFTNGPLKALDPEDDQIEVLKTALGILKMNGIGLERGSKKKDMEDETQKKTQE